MKRRLVAILLISALSLSLTGCFGNTRNPFADDEDEEETTSDYFEDDIEDVRPLLDLNDLKSVDAEETFGEYYVSDVDTPWGVGKDLKMADGTVRNYFCDYCFDSSYNIVNENMNYIATVSRPIVTVFDSTIDGYVIYEVTYTQLFPICSREPSSVFMSFFSYHNVGYVDYYTGATFPTVNMSTQIDSFRVYGDVIYNGSRYNVAYYEYREDEVLSSSYEYQDDGYYINRTTVQITSTSYFLVPEGYDGILLYVYIGYDFDKSAEEVLADDDAYFTPPGFFGDDENLDDYVFFGINAPE